MSSISGHVLSQAAYTRRGTCSAKKDLAVLTEDGHLVRVTLWSPNHTFSVAINDKITIARPVAKQYYGQCFATNFRSTISSQSSSSGVMTIRTAVRTGGFKFETFEEIKTRISDQRPAYGYVKATFSSFTNEIWYIGCAKCKKAMAVDKCPSCGVSPRKYARLVAYFEQGDMDFRVTFFSDTLDCLLGTDANSMVASDEGHQQLWEELQSMCGREFGFHVKGQKRAFESEEDGLVEITRWTGRPPFFVFQE